MKNHLIMNLKKDVQWNQAIINSSFPCQSNRERLFIIFFLFVCLLVYLFVYSLIYLNLLLCVNM